MMQAAAMRRAVPQRTLAATLGVSLLLLAVSASAHDWKAQRHLVEIGAYGGLFFPPSRHELYDQNLPHQALEKLSAAVGGRLAYLPWSFLGLEVEGGVMPTSTEGDTDANVLGWAVRGHILIQYPARFAPFALVGGGLLGVASDDDVLGDDSDLGLHVGVGFKVFATRWLALRFDGRQNINSKLGPGGRDSYFEVLGGLSLVLGYEEPKPRDTDGDGVLDVKDKCPNQAAATPDGCPPKDTDGDGVVDDKDKCPNEAAATPDGCPPKDSDGDGVIDDKDKCPDVPASTEDGCPPDSDGDGVIDDNDKCPNEPARTKDGCPPDGDGDGILDDQDKCPDKAETKNGFEDTDGCPDELPKKLKRFTGSIRGIYFATGKAKIRRRSHRVLNAAVRVLNEFADLRLLIRGHTDNRGGRGINMELSRQRAESVKSYLVQKGVLENRLQTVGVGPDEPIANNRTRVGRAKNRRIEFRILTD